MSLEQVPTGQWNRDNLMRQPISVGSIPTSGTIQTTFTLPAGSSGSWAVGFSSSNQHLSDWNFAATLVVDDNTTLDSNGDWAFQWPMGESLSGTVEAKVFMSSPFIDWARSSDISNERTVVIYLLNNDSVSHTLYLYIKGYTQSVNVGGS